jgi:hypothetical protein
MYTNSALEGAPNNFSIVLVPQNEEKWKLCAATKEDQMRWCHVLEKYVESLVVVPQGQTHHGRPSIIYHIDDEAGPTPANQQVRIVESSNSADPTQIAQNHSTIVREKKSGKKRLKSGGKAELISSDSLEYIMALLAFNACIAMMLMTKIEMMRFVYIAIANYVVGYTIYLRGKRCAVQAQLAADLADKLLEEEPIRQQPNDPVTAKLDTNQTTITTTGTQPASSSTTVSPVKGGKPLAGSSFKEVTTPQLQSPNHTWYKCDYRMFNVRIGPNYDRFKKKAPSAAPLYDIFAVDVFW